MTNPRVERIIPRMASFRFSDFLPNTPNKIPATLKANPQAGMIPAHKLIKPQRALHNAMILFRRSSGSNRR